MDRLKAYFPLNTLTYQPVALITGTVAGVNWRQLTVLLKCPPFRRLPSVDLGGSSTNEVYGEFWVILSRPDPSHPGDAVITFIKRSVAYAACYNKFSTLAGCDERVILSGIDYE
jgi:hypothetical protein